MSLKMRLVSGLILGSCALGGCAQPSDQSSIAPSTQGALANARIESSSLAQEKEAMMGESIDSAVATGRYEALMRRLKAVTHLPQRDSRASSGPGAAANSSAATKPQLTATEAMLPADRTTYMTKVRNSSPDDRQASADLAILKLKLVEAGGRR